MTERDGMPSIQFTDEQNAREELLEAEIAFRFKNPHSLPSMENLSDEIYHLHIAGEPEWQQDEGIALNEGQPATLEAIEKDLQHPDKYWRSPRNNPPVKEK
jgi:hypothetical protein